MGSHISLEHRQLSEHEGIAAGADHCGDCGDYRALHRVRLQTIAPHVPLFSFSTHSADVWWKGDHRISVRVEHERDRVLKERP